MSHLSHRSQPSTPPSRGQRPSGGRVVAGSLALSVGISAAVLFTGAGPATAAVPRAQAVGRFLDGAAGGNPIEDVVNLHDARATNPGTVSDQNPLDITIGKQLDLPLTGALQLPGHGNAVHVGAANQVAKARSDGYSYGASGAVANSGGISVGGNNSAYPAGATIDLSSAAAPNPGTIPLPGAGSAAAFGGVTAQVGAVAALASTPAGFSGKATTHYSIAGLKLRLASPALGGVLAELADALKAPAPPQSPLPAPGLPASCSFKSQALPPLSLSGGAVTVDPVGGAITIDVAALLHTLGLNLNALPANTDLLARVLTYLSSPAGLSRGLQNAIGNTMVTQKANFMTCMQDFTAAFPAPLKDAVKTAFDQISAGQTQLQDAINQIVDQLGKAGGDSPFAPIAEGLAKAMQIGVNVQPHGPKGSYTSPLRATPNQATPVVAGQTIVRAIEIDLGGGQLSLALANAAVGPSHAPASHAPRTHSPAPTHRPHDAGSPLPTGIPAGQAPTGGGPGLPLVLLALGVLVAGAGALTWQLQGRRH